MFDRLRSFLVCAFLLLSACQIRRVFVLPELYPFESMSGFASLKITAAQQSARSRFSFLFHLPGRGRIDVFDPLGRLFYQILIVDQRSYFVVPSKKVYWQGGEDEIMVKFIGFPLYLDEVVALMSGQWRNANREDGTPVQEDWNLERDARGRIWKGSRGAFLFQVESHFEKSPWAQTIVFRHSQVEGRVKILDVHFDPPELEGAFSTGPLSRFDRVTWEEMEKFLDDQS